MCQAACRLWIGLALVGATVAAPAASQHPLDPLSGAEIERAASLVRAQRAFPKGALFPVVGLKEPPKAELVDWKPGASWKREAEVVVFDRAANRTYEAVVDLTAGRVASFVPRPGVQPLVLVEEYEALPGIVRADPDFQAAMRRRGIDDVSRVWIDAWAPGTLVPAGMEGMRLLRGVSYLQDGAHNFYGRPIEGVTALVDMNRRRVIEVLDTGTVPIAGAVQELDRDSIAARRPLRDDLKPLTVATPEGASYELAGQEVRWQRWRFRWALHPREGLVLYGVSYDDPSAANGGAARSILHRASLSEMVVPYADPSAHWVWRNAFDEGEYGLGRLASPLEPGADAPANAVFFDAEFADDFGEPYALERAVGLYERDGGVLWKHFDFPSGVNQSRRARELVIFFFATIGNYDYSIAWVFRQDGGLACEVSLTGILLAQGVAGSPMDLASAHVVAPGIASPHHQHFFNFRLDFDVDGLRNDALEMNTFAMPVGDANRHGNAFTMVETALPSERLAQRELDPATARKWRFVNSTKRTGFLLVPGESAVPYAAPDSAVRRRARFLDHQLWVTRYREGERHAAGVYPSQRLDADNLLAWSSNDEPLAAEDLVVWYTFGVTHTPRPEEWPIMNAHRTGFTLLPAGFFRENPALDVP